MYFQLISIHLISSQATICSAIGKLHVNLLPFIDRGGHEDPHTTCCTNERWPPKAGHARHHRPTHAETRSPGGPWWVACFCQAPTDWSLWACHRNRPSAFCKKIEFLFQSFVLNFTKCFESFDSLIESWTQGPSACPHWPGDQILLAQALHHTVAPGSRGQVVSLSQGSKESGTNEWKKKKKIHQTSQNYTELLCPKLLCMLHTYTTLPFGFGRTDKRPVPHKDSPEPFSPQHQIWSLISTSGMGSRSLCKFKRYSGYLALAQSLRVSFSPGVGRLTNLGLAHFGSDFRNVRRAWRPFCIQFPGWWEWHDIRDKLTHFTTTLS